MEVWKEIESKGFRWLVSSCGRVKTPAHESGYTRTRNGVVQLIRSSFPERDLTPVVGKHGYLEVAAMKGGRRVKHLVHRLIGIAFVPGYQDGLTINHIDGNKLNNCPENLEWISLARNTKHQWDSGLVNLRGDAHPGRKLTSKQVVYIRRLLAQGAPAHTLAVIAGVSPSAIELIRDGKRWAAV